MSNFLQDVRYALRTLVKNPGFALVALLALALGIGANTAIFSMVYAVMLRPLPYPEPHRLVMVWEDYTKRGGPQREWTNQANFHDWRKQNGSFEEMFILNGWNPTLTGDGEPELLRGASVSHGMFKTLGVQPAMGRGFTPEEDLPNGGNPVVLSDALWKRRFGGNSNVLGRTMLLGGVSSTVVGVMPADFRFPVVPDAQLWQPLQLNPTEGRGNAFLRTIARMKPGVSLAQAQADMSTIASRLEQQYPDTNKSAGIYLSGLQADMALGSGPALLVLLGAVGFVLLIACANVANLLLARASARQKEVAVRVALGASRSRLIRQLLTESVLLSAMGGAAGLLIAYWTSGALAAAAPGGLAGAYALGIDSVVLAFTAFASLFTGVLFGLAPALEATRTSVHDTLKEGARGTAGGKQMLRRVLVVSEVALSLVLLIGAGLLMRSFHALLQQDPGFNPRNLLTMQLILPQTKYAEAPQTVAMFSQLLDAIRALPGVKAAGAVNNIPLGPTNTDTNFFIEGRPEPPADQRLGAQYTPVTTGYHEAMGIPLLRGRGFEARDDAQAGRVILVNETFARTHFPGQDPVGKRIGFGRRAAADTVWREIIGVVGNVRFFGLDQEERPAVYFPHSQVAARRMVIVVRGVGDPLALAGTLRSTVWRFDRDLAIPTMLTMEQIIQSSVADRKFTLFLLGVFAGLALFLASIGLYGVMAYAVAQRTREIGIRMALGAHPRDVLQMVLGQGLVLTGVGLAVGLVLALALGRSLGTMLYGIAPYDPLTFVVVALTLGSVAMLASYVPARRAMRVDPVIALRDE